ncbi:unnamed protein product [Chondrus crispus]|uniref:Uncharacterized protein n=1 Tax=Chondrus crispus TaxID=2769 RepID=R7Q8S6_CHOCR|nr:unnamed protein product [Chondrus crispus]CDF34439.1 unnamed protein product [Chondrus crispus]|eukprot:XP_005714258.1 unnamed protein product [Chondrus crispus]
MPEAKSARGLVQVTSHYQDGKRQESLVDRKHLAEVDRRPRRRRVTIAWDDAPTLVLIAVNPENTRSMEALPILIKSLQSVRGVVVAVEQNICDRCDINVPVVVPLLAHAVNSQPEKHRLLSTSMDNLSLTDSFKFNPLTKSKAAHEPSREIVRPDDVDLVMTLGGDGLILHVIQNLFPKAVPPFMPFNLGSMGFLTPFNFSDHQKDVSSVLTGQNNSVTMRMRLKCVIVRQTIGPNHTCSPTIHNFEDNALNDETREASVTEEHHVLNELVIDRGPAPYLSNLEVLCDNCPVTRVQADGIIVATPTGSTAYSLSSGGSMVHPSVPAILFTPICPHSLSFRPVLFPDYVTLEIKVPQDSRASAWVSFDGRHRMELMKGDKVVVTVSPWSVPTFSRADTTNDWFKSVSHCLRWNERVVQGQQYSN